MKKYDAVIFDLDGTLTNTLEDLKDSVNYALKSFGFPERNIDEIRSFVGNGVRRLICLSVPSGTSGETCEECLSIFKEYYKEHSADKTVPYDGIYALLENLKLHKVKSAVVTNKMNEAAQAIVKHFFDGLIDVTVGQLDGVAQKPEPDGVYAALKALGVSKKNAVYVGDSEVDCLTAKNAGLPCVGVTWGFRSRQTLAENGAQFIIDRPEELFVVE